MLNNAKKAVDVFVKKVRRPIIQDKVVVADCSPQLPNPVGEAFKFGMALPTSPMSDTERKDMLTRMEMAIFALMDQATSTYETNCYQSGTIEVDPDYITRLSTNEFFFYTKEPLTLAEFESLQNKLAKIAKSQPKGVQLVLGSFAVKTDDGKVMNTVAHIHCGQVPEFHFIVKNYTSPIDVRYKIPDGKGNNTLLEILDKNTHNSQVPLPSLVVDGRKHRFRFNNLIPCKTPGGTPFVTAVDICLDHYRGVAKANVATLLQSTVFKDQPISHMLIANCEPLLELHSLTSKVAHNSPDASPSVSKRGVPQKKVVTGRLFFGNDNYSVYDVNKCPIFTVEEELYAVKNALISTLTHLGIQVLLPSPLKMQFQDSLNFLCIKKYLDTHAIPYTCEDEDYIAIADHDLPREKAAIMNDILLSPVLREQIVKHVQYEMQQLESLRPHIKQLLAQIPAISNVEFSINPTVFLLPIKDLRCSFSSAQDAEFFVTALKKHYPQTFVFKDATKAQVSVSFTPQLFNNKALLEMVMQTYTDLKNAYSRSNSLFSIPPEDAINTKTKSEIPNKSMGK